MRTLSTRCDSKRGVHEWTNVPCCRESLTRCAQPPYGMAYATVACTLEFIISRRARETVCALWVGL